MKLHDINGNVLHESKKESFKEAVEECIALGYSLRGLDASKQDLSGAYLVCGEFSFADFTGADLSDALMDHSNIYHTVFTDAILSRAELRGMVGTVPTGFKGIPRELTVLERG